MSIWGLISQDFLVVPATLPIEEAISLADELEPAYLVVSDPASESYGLLDMDQLAKASRAGSGALRDLAIPMVPAVDVSAIVTGPDRAIIRDGGELMGVWDALAPAERAGTGRIRRGHEDYISDPVRAGHPGETHGPDAAGTHGAAAPVSMHLGANLPARVALGEATSLLAWVGAADEDVLAAIPVDVPEGEIVDLVVQARKGFELEGSGEGSVRAGDGELKPFRARLRATELGLGLVRVFAFHAGRTLGSVTLRPEVTEVAGARGMESARSAVDLTERAYEALPDLSLLVMERRTNGQTELEFLVTAIRADLGLYQHRFGPVPLGMDPAAFFTEFFAEIEEAGEQGLTRPEEVEALLARKGVHLFESLVPRSLRERLWALRDRIGSVQISSDEPWIPWELCRLSGEEDGEWKEDAFFCERYEITRWFPDMDRRPRLTLSNVALVAPADSGLAAVADERAYFSRLPARGISVTSVPARTADVQRALSAGTYDGFHFSGHGMYRVTNPDRSPIVLEGGEQLYPEALGGRTRNLGRACPLVFLNACQAGRPGMGLVDVGGWAKRFLQAGAGAFVGAYWSIYDQPASAFSQALYNHLFEGATFGAAARAARREIREAGDPTWLAYTVYADPSAAVFVDCR
jgi:hypothetical protein